MESPQGAVGGFVHYRPLLRREGSVNFAVMNMCGLNIGRVIVALRDSRQLSQERLALEAGVDRRYLSDLENDKRNPSLEIIGRIAAYFGLSLSRFFMLAERGADDFNPRNALCEAGCEDAVVFESPDYAKALVGYTSEGKAVYAYSAMVACLIEEGMTHDDAVEFIDYNTLRALPYAGENAPIIMFEL